MKKIITTTCTLFLAFSLFSNQEINLDKLDKKTLKELEKNLKIQT